MKEIKFKLREKVLTEFCGELIEVEIVGINKMHRDTDEVIYKVQGSEEHNYYFEEELMERFLFKDKSDALETLIHRKEQLEKLINSI